MDSPPLSPTSSMGSTPPPPLELARDRDDFEHLNIADGEADIREADDESVGLAARLAPWLQRVSTHAVRWAPLPAHGGRLGVVVELHVDVTDAALDEDDEFEHLLQLREAVDLVLLTLAVEPSALRALVRTGDTEWQDPMETRMLDEADAMESVLAHGARTELRLRLEFRGLQTRLLEDHLVPRFIRPFRTGLSTNRAFLRLRDQLADRYQHEEAARTRVSQLTVPVTMAIDSGSLRQISLLDADDFFVHLTEFSKTLVRDRARVGWAQWRVDTQSVPFVVEGIDLVLRRYCITNRVAQAAKSFMAVPGMPVRVKQLNLDPRLISCADDDVRDFVATLTADAKHLRIDTGMDPDEEFAEAIDEHDQDRRETIQVILGAVAKVETITELNLGGLLTLCVAPQNRRMVWQLFFSHILSRDVVPETITFEDQVLFEQEDQEWIRDEAALWRERCPGRKLFIKTLTLRLQGTENDTIEQFLLAIDDVENIELINSDAGDFSPQILIDDPDVPNKPVLEELALDDLMLLDVASMPRFLEKLRWDVDERSALATTLQRFSVAQNVAGWEHLYIWDRAALEALDRALTTNRSLCDVRALVDFSDEFYGECQTRLDVHTRTQLPAAPAVRTADVVKARTLAFLSAIRNGGDSTRSLLDAAAVSHILEFAAPHQMRKVELRGWDLF